MVLPELHNEIDGTLTSSSQPHMVALGNPVEITIALQSQRMGV